MTASTLLGAQEPGPRENDLENSRVNLDPGPRENDPRKF